jgi:predicted NAD/FAD-binding protein
VRLATPVRSILRDADGVWLGLPGGECERFDEVVLACHSDQALALLGSAATPAERASSAPSATSPTAPCCIPTPPAAARPARLVGVELHGRGRASGGQQPVSVSYLINRLQPLPTQTPVIVSLNPHVEPDPAKVIGDWDYDHPLFDQAAIGAQAQLDAIQGVERLWFCGAWGGYGFHEDGLNSALAVANRLGCRAPWQAATDRIESAA